MKNLFLNALAKSINTYLSLDPESRKRLLLLQGKTLTVELLPFHFIFQLVITDQNIEIQTNENSFTETKISGTPMQMLGMILNKHHRQQFFADDLKIEGNAELGQRIIEIFDELQIDWEEHLSRIVGDIPAYHAGQFIRGITSWIENTEKKFTSDINEYIHEEVEWLPSREALEDFFNDVDHLRMDADRIEAKMRHLKALIIDPENGQ